MIELNVREYCQACMEFDPQVTRRPDQFYRNDGKCIVCGDTIVECANGRHCEALYNYLKRGNNDT